MNSKTLWNDNWYFAKTALGVNWEDRTLWEREMQPADLPHDWLIYDTKNLYEDSIGWYRKKFVYSASGVKRAGEAAQENLREQSKSVAGNACTTCDERVILRFEGVYMDSSIYINGVCLGDWKYGYSTFDWDITDHLREGENEVVLRVTFQAPNSRWYSGAGIYRNVWMIRLPETHIPLDGIYTSSVETENGYDLTIDTELEWGAITENYELEYCLHYAGDSKNSAETENREIFRVKQPLAGGQEKTSVAIPVDNPRKWDITDPYLYDLTVRLCKLPMNDGENGAGEALQKTEITQEEHLRIGFRTMQFDPARGFLLNGRKVRLNGACDHHDLGALGAAFHKEAMRRKFELMRSMGVNAVRTSHNMPAVELMELADEMGFLIVSEAFDMWEMAKNPYDYARFFKEWMEKDVRSWIRRDRNHPSVIMWSIGNEIPDTHADAHGQEITRSLLAVVRKWDYRKVAPVTIGSNYMPWENAQKCADIVKVAGYNYAEKYYAEHHEKHPDWIIYGSETSSVVQSRGVYHFPLERANLIEADEQCSALGNSTTSWAAKNTEYCITMDRDTPYSCGQFIWTAIDYIGEPTPYQTKNSYFGQMDTAGFPKDSYYVFRSEWTDGKKDPMIHVYPYWDFNPGQQVDVRITSNAPEVELFVNGVSQGKQQIDHQKGTVLQPSWKVPYAPGSICAVAYDETGREIARQERHSFGNTDHYVLKANKSALHADGEDMIFVEISAEDRNGYPVENASDYVRVTVEGAGRLVGLDNGDSADYDAYKGTVRKLFQGKLLAMIAAKTTPGEIRVTVEDAWAATVNSMTNETGTGTATAAAGHRTATVTLQAVEAPIRPGVCATEENREYPPAFVDPGFVPVRKLEMSAPYMRLTPEKPYVLLHTRIYPMEATDRKLLWSITDASGIPSPVAKLEELEDGKSIRITGVSDGSFQVRCMTCNGTPNIKMISQLDFAVEGMGQTFHSPYEPVTGISYVGSFGGDVSRGVENSAGTDKAQPTGLVYEALDFGEFVSDEITLSIFANDNDPHRIQIWKGEPEESGSGTQGTLVGEITYQKPGIWEVFQPDTFVLPRRLKGVTKLTIVSESKIFLKEFHFTRQEKAYARLSALTDGVTYGDSFVRTGDAVEQIGNNVSLEFTDMNFGEAGTDSIVICGRTPLQQNTIQLRFTDGATQVLPFPHSEEYRELRFPLERVTGEQNVTFVFLPGCNFDFKWFRFEKSGSEE